MYIMEAKKNQKYLVFTLKNFITPEQCYKLREYLLALNNKINDGFNKLRIEHNDIQRIKSFHNLDILKFIDKSLSSKNFFKALKNFCTKNNIELGNYKLQSINPIVNFYNFYILDKKPIRLNYEFSYLKNNAVILPHTDSSNKLLTLMLYLPSKKQNNSMSLGTYFHEPKSGKEEMYSNLKNIKADDTNFKNFNEDTVISYKSKYTSKYLTGFFKNDQSWHSIPKIKLDNKELRVSININYYYSKKVIFEPILVKFKNYLKNIIY